VTSQERTRAAQGLRALRLSRGWSLLDQARALRDAARRLRTPTVAQARLSTIQRTVARWENESVRPGERYQLLLAHVYAQQAATTALGPGSDFDQLMTVFALYGVEAHRISELRDLVTATLTRGTSGLLAFLSPNFTASLMSALTDPSRTEPELVVQLGATVADLNARVGAVPFVRLQLGLVPLIEACRTLLTGPVSDALRDQLLKVSSTAYTLAARLAFETYDDPSSTGFYTEALNAADRLPDPWHRAVVRTSQTMVTLYSTGDLRKAQRIAAEAVRDARQGSSALLRARAYALQAEMNARADDTRRAFTALHVAWHEVDRASADDPAPGGFDAGRLHGFEGLCHLYAGDPAKAESQFADSASTLQRPRDAVQRGIVLTDRAMARIRLDAPKAAAKLLHECVNLTASTRGRVPAQRIREARLALSPWRNERFVAELDDHMHSALIAGI
jgi:transcriptional regulator with XRE-family HTH domain